MTRSLKRLLLVVLFVTATVIGYCLLSHPSTSEDSITASTQVVANQDVPLDELQNDVPIHECEASCNAQELYGSFRMKFKNKTFDVYAVEDIRSIQMFWKDANSSIYQRFSRVNAQVEKEGRVLKMATNGGIYMKDNSPLGLYVEQGVQRKKINKSKNEYGNFYLQPNGVFYVTDSSAHIVPTDKYERYKRGVRYATQSGPMLVVNGEINKKFDKDSKHNNIRNGVGVTKDGKVYFIISNQPLSLHAFASFFKEGLECHNALYLDGAISKMYLPDLNRMQLDGNFGVIIGIVE
jgi:uncharacterized protein YigE (DUF2233 family)